MRLRHHSSWLTILVVAALLAMPAASRATYPGKPGPIAYTKFKDTLVPEGELMVVHKEGGLLLHGPRHSDSPQPLTTDWRDSDPAFSPDGRRIAFAGTREPEGSGIYLMRRDGTGLRFLAKGGGPYFSADGRKLVFVRSDSEHGLSHLFMITLASGAVRQLTFGHHEDSAPVFAPNGKRIVFASNRREDGPHDTSDLWSIPYKGGKPKLLVNGAGAEVRPDVAPDGGRIAYVVEQNAYYGYGNLVIARADGTFVRSLDQKAGPECRPCFGYPAWAPDGKHLAVVEITNNVGSTSLQVMRPDGTHRRQFDAGTTEVEGVGSHVERPSWGPLPR
jgi:Tol biopolymer transport system component